MDSDGCPDTSPDPFPYWIFAIVAIIPVIGIIV